MKGLLCMDRFLIEFASVDLENAEFNATRTDDFHTRVAAYHVEQAIEKY